ncbi:MAG: hypothetical protein ACRDYC_11195 [Acidimicrobiales bacterium]
MAARSPNRSQSGAKAEARRRVSERMADVEEVLGSYLAAGCDAVRLRAEADSAEERQADALVKLAGMLGRTMAAEMAGVEERQVRSVLARRPRAPRSEASGGEVERGGSDGDGLSPKR